MIVGYKTERFITVQGHDPHYGYRAFGIEATFELHATKGWRRVSRRRQLLGTCDYLDAHTAATQGSSVSFRRAHHNAKPHHVESVPITEKMQIRHGWYRRKMRTEKPDAECYA